MRQDAQKVQLAIASAENLVNEGSVAAPEMSRWVVLRTEALIKTCTTVCSPFVTVPT